MKNLFERLSEENQKKLMSNDLSAHYAKNYLTEWYFAIEITFDVLHHIYYILTEETRIDPSKVFELFEEN